MILPAIFRPHRCDVWREVESLNANGTRGTPTWQKIGTAVPCRFQTGESVKGPNGEFILDESDNLFTLDLLHFEEGVDVYTGDVLRQATGPDAGNYWTVRGDAQQRTQFGHKLSIRASRTPDVHATIAEAYT